MPRKKQPCTNCGKPVQPGSTSRPDIMCRHCRYPSKASSPLPQCSACPQPVARPGARYCTDHRGHKRGQCKACGESFYSLGNYYCSDECRPHVKGTALVRYMPPTRTADVTRIPGTRGPWVEGPCRDCGTRFTGRHETHRCPDCTNARRTERRRRWKRANSQESNHRKRARKYGCHYEPIDVRAIYDRDGWVCGICQKIVDKKHKFPHRMSPSLDHVIPLSLGGPHTPANVRLAHFTCNSKRGNRVNAEQPALMG